MKEKILEILKENRDSFVSGQEISNKLGITRAAVWKHIKRLENDGYKIESMSKNGYKLVYCPDVLTYEEIKDTLKSKIIGQRIVHFDTLGSTSEKARELAECGEKEGTIIIAEEQSDGRGRIGRKWFSQNRLGIWMSVILRPGIRMNEVPLVTGLACEAVAASIRKFAENVEIKWPNDIFLNGKKLCGILTQASGETDMVDYIIVGIGINVNETIDDFPDEIKDKATSIMLETGKVVSRKQLLCNVISEFDGLYCKFKNTLPLNREQ